MYRDILSPRQIWSRIQALPSEAHLWQVIRADAEEAKAEEREAEINDLLAKFQPKKEG
jgi:hypothetical protein